jgi:hypothetical protein
MQSLLLKEGRMALAQRYTGNIRKDYLARDILLSLLGTESTAQGVVSGMVSLQQLVACSSGLAELFRSSLYACMDNADTAVIDEVPQNSPIVLDGELGDL